MRAVCQRSDHRSLQGRQGQDGQTVAVAELQHVVVWVMAEHLQPSSHIIPGMIADACQSSTRYGDFALCVASHMIKTLLCLVVTMQREK